MEVPMGRFQEIGKLAARGVIAVIASASVHAAKPAPPPVNWSCTIAFDGSLTYTDPVDHTVQTIPTAMQSDGGAYVDGADGVQCYVNQAPNSGNYQNLFVNADGASPRYFWMPGQVALTPYSRTGYTSFENRQPGYFDTTDIATVGATSPGVSVTERRRIRVGVGYALDFNGGIMFGDSLSSDPLNAGSTSAWVTTLTFNTAGGACSWKVRVFPYAAVEAGDASDTATRYVALQETVKGKRVRTADFTLPISATVRLKPGANGCS
jgi:hypothetical protein